MGKLSDLFSVDRYKSWARQASERSVIHAGELNDPASGGGSGSILPTHHSYSSDKTPHAHAYAHAQAGRDDSEKPHFRPSPTGPTGSQRTNNVAIRNDQNEKVADHADATAAAATTTTAAAVPADQLDGPTIDAAGPPQPATFNHTVDSTTSVAPPPAPPPHKSEDAISRDSALEHSRDGGADPESTTAVAGEKRSIPTRMRDGSKRFILHCREALFHTWVNVLLVFVPVGIIVNALGLSSAIIFAANAIAIIPLAGMLALATEAVAARLGDTWGALLNVSFGNAVELIIFIIALVKNEIGIVQAALLGSILANLLLILGMAFLFGGLRYQEQLYNNTVTQMSACLLSLSVMSLLLPTAFHASFKLDSSDVADSQVLKVSRGTSVVLLLVYVLYLLFQLKSHSYLYESTPQEVIDEESHPGVFADIMNYSSSSDSSSSDDSSDSDASGSVTTARRRFRRAFKNRRRRKSSASTSSTTVSAAVSAHSGAARPVDLANSRLDSNQSVTTDDGDVDGETNHGPRVIDFVTKNPSVQDFEPNNRRRKQKKHRKHSSYRHRTEVKEPHSASYEATTPQILDKTEGLTEEPSQTLPEIPKVNFADEVMVETDPISSARAAYNKRQFGRGASFRPHLPKMLSQNVFVAAPPSSTPTPRPEPTDSQASRLRRISSLPDRLDQPRPIANVSRPPPSRAVALPPFHHQTVREHFAVTRNRGDDASDASVEDKPEMSRTAAVVLLLISTALVAVCAEFMVDAIPSMLSSSNVSQAFIGLIVVPIVGNAAEHVTAVTVATKNKMDLAIGVAVGSSIQIALMVTPLVVLLGWIMGRDMSLYFNLFDTISLFVTAFVVNFLVLDGRSNYLEGSLLIAAYVIIALGAFFYPTSGQASSLGGGGME